MRRDDDGAHGVGLLADDLVAVVIETWNGQRIGVFGRAGAVTMLTGRSASRSGTAVVLGGKPLMSKWTDGTPNLTIRRASKLFRSSGFGPWLLRAG
jgi:hypothetical protein